MRHVNYLLKPAAIDNAKPREKAYPLTDGGGLYIDVLPTGSKVWRFKYHRDGKREKVERGQQDYGLGLARGAALTKRPPMAEVSAGALELGEDSRHPGRIGGDKRARCVVALLWRKRDQKPAAALSGDITCVVVNFEVTASLDVMQFDGGI